LDQDRRAAKILEAVHAGHRWIFSATIAAAYYHQMHSVQCRGVATNQFISGMSEVLADTNRCLFLDETVEIEGDYHQKDRHVVAAAAAVPGCYLVTMDDRLRASLLRSDIPQRYGFQVVGLNEAEDLLVSWYGC
jgi:hypothetical protein